MHCVFNGGFSFAFDSVSVKIHYNNIVFNDSVIRHAGRSEIYISGFGVADADVAPGFNSKTGTDHSEACIDKKSFIVHFVFPPEKNYFTIGL